ncbi:3-deoxy-7-phosphoheptulonate synthase [Marinibactrum halimedae]|uniref:3-deoxy-7-phosphoheptulonate synthase n=1 Tax=Marinibactrum halimedae TaxID=1444977 RepID=A0AA37WKS9_9GAMM|nr:3-deoxy-7-phosphoheptulonate synthase [Marinibactrum halimedae]MCD9459713.1 3-deoxy-7-phosphoheptulonate synthase [Marinibactrum halimedae]GLS24530.1 phospho-2-dehydro-3-deoxyheptonate aldolase [Marinibactrum halimedae]
MSTCELTLNEPGAVLESMPVSVSPPNKPCASHNEELSSSPPPTSSNSVPLPTPQSIRTQFAIDDATEASISANRIAINRILKGQDHRQLVITGPCSIHCPKATLEYAEKLRALQNRVGDQVLLVMRCYLEKPRTTVGWKGFINDPYMNNTHNLQEGIEQSRKLLIAVANLGLPIAVEALNPLLVPFYEDVVSWAAIGARTVESQTHRELASALPFAAGLKNTTAGDIDIAIDALEASRASHTITAINTVGQLELRTSTGNPHSHLILRGGKSGPNYTQDHVQSVEAKLQKRSITSRIIIDCSHANSGKQANRQPEVLQSVRNQLLDGNQSIAGIMLESHLHQGKQKISNDPSQLSYGVSITDECIGWDSTATELLNFAQQLREWRTEMSAFQPAVTEPKPMSAQQNMNSIHVEAE